MPRPPRCPAALPCRRRCIPARGRFPGRVAARDPDGDFHRRLIEGSSPPIPFAKGNSMAASAWGTNCRPPGSWLSPNASSNGSSAAVAASRCRTGKSRANWPRPPRSAIQPHRSTASRGFSFRFSTSMQRTLNLSFLGPPNLAQTLAAEGDELVQVLRAGRPSRSVPLSLRCRRKDRSASAATRDGPSRIEFEPDHRVVAEHGPRRFSLEARSWRTRSSWLRSTTRATPSAAISSAKRSQSNTAAAIADGSRRRRGRRQNDHAWRRRPQRRRPLRPSRGRHRAERPDEGGLGCLFTRSRLAEAISLW